MPSPGPKVPGKPVVRRPVETLAERTDERLPRSLRIRRSGEIQRLQQGGQKFAAGALLLLITPTPRGARRLAVTVSSKVGNSVVRSKVKRRFREIFRRNRGSLPPSIDVVMIARSQAAQATMQALTADFLKAAEQATRKIRPAVDVSSGSPAGK